MSTWRPPRRMERTPSTAAAARKQMILPSKSNGSNRALNRVGVQFGASVGQEASQSMPARQRVGDELEWDGRAGAIAVIPSGGCTRSRSRSVAGASSAGPAPSYDLKSVRARRRHADRRSFTAMPRAASKSRSPVRKKRRRAALPWGRTHGPEGGRKARRREPRARRC